jgi:phosphomethylpyrimidine synthase
MTQLENALKKIISPEIESVAFAEKIDPHKLALSIAEGKTVIPVNINRKNRNLIGIGSSLRIKVNANVGTSPLNDRIDNEKRKTIAAYEAGADAIMDLSISGDLSSIRKELMDSTPLTFGTVPIYEIMSESHGSVDNISGDRMIEIIEQQAKEGVDFMTVHCGVTRRAIPHIDHRLMGVVSRGGSVIYKWMKHTGLENPYFERFDDVCDIARAYDVTLSLGDALRPGALADAGDDAQKSEISLMGECVRRARERGVQVMVEGPGHVPMNLIRDQVALMRKECFDAPLYLLGPLVTDRAAGHDHIAAAIGGAIAGFEGASFLCYVTPAEHLSLPDENDVRDGVIAARIASHAADIGKGIPSAIEEDRDFSRMRRAFDWTGMFASAIDPRKSRAYRCRSTHNDESVCSMCGEFCAMKPEEKI